VLIHVQNSLVSGCGVFRHVTLSGLVDRFKF
jgi:hypothetical protein